MISPLVIPDRLAGAVLVTGNRHKLEESRRILGFEIAGKHLDLPELQGLDLATVLEAKADAAWRALGRALVVEDTGLGLDALGGFPGPLVKWLLAAVGADGIARLGRALDNPRAAASCGLFYRDAKSSVFALGHTPGRLVGPRGEGGFGWDPVFVPNGQDQTYAEMERQLKDLLGHRGRAWRELVRRLTRHE